ncbi:hypothetical protein EYF80_056627 [Liparis tanakae]|uniref:Uncharacterized protein n=1 Tax=Liparis tanakae TaxID=230148 RepID=A0A4Z2EXA5_9TELE|nr:hypothetical protein EYF80_056627 [Liparis tanakae]
MELRPSFRFAVTRTIVAHAGVHVTQPPGQRREHAQRRRGRRDTHQHTHH